MPFHGKNFIGSQLSADGETLIHGFNPATGTPLADAFHQATPNEIDRAAKLAASAFEAFREKPAEDVAVFLEHVAAEIEALGDALLDQASLESGLTKDRLTGERARTVNQLRMFAGIVRDGAYLDVRIDTALPDRKPLPRPDLRRMLFPLGPVAVFGASNFPLAFSVAGGDTASALAAKNPVIVKAHPAQPGTCEMTAAAIIRAVQKSGMPEGTFSMVHATDPDVSLQLVKHPSIKAVGFTGSERAGRAIFNAAAQRPEPIPAYVEMGSNNPVFVLPGALEKTGDTVMQGLFNSINLGVGQFCTSPGVVIGNEGSAFQNFGKNLSALFEKAQPGTMLHPSILKGYSQNVEHRSQTPGVATVRSGEAASATKTQASPVLFETDVPTWLNNSELAAEIFGPSAVLVRAQSKDQLLQIARTWQGTLTASVFGTDEDLAEHKELVSILEQKAGRIIFNGFPTGVEVTHAMHHGGPYPATADPKFTSVGSAAIFRFLRPVCFQNFPPALLPPELHDENPRQIWRLINGTLTTEQIKKAKL